MHTDSPPAPRHVVLMRHARAEEAGSSDMERALAERGRTDAGAAGAWLASRDFLPDQALVSSAVRARQTWDAVAAAAGWSVDAVVETALYSAEPQSALDLLRLAPAGVRSLLVIGHNPTVGHLAQLLSDAAGDDDAMRDMAGGYPTCALTLFEYDGEWADLDLGTARVAAFHVGRG